MKLLDHHGLSLAAIILQLCMYAAAETSSSPTVTPTTTSSHVKTTPPPSNATCESRTINYITHSLASICLRHNRTQLRSTIDSTSSTSTLPIEGSPSSQTEVATSSLSLTVTTTSPSAGVVPIPSVDVDPDSSLDDSSFLSFEEWKKQTLEKEGLIDAAIIGRRPSTGKDGEKIGKAEGTPSGLEGLAEGGDIDLDFGAYLGDRPADAASVRSKEEVVPPKATENPASAKHVEKPRYRSKDAGKTCKERFNFASLAFGGQVMKTNPEAKSASALLKEDRDVYLLNTCQAKNKFFIVELSESILVETVALANFEFFSSTFRQFRVSVSDKYPVKLDRWVEIGIFEARNSREIQAFLVEDPRIWARYLRVEFLSHFGNEFYCPVSLLRVHGRTMIQDVLSMEHGAGGEDDGDYEQEDLSEKHGEVLVPEAVAEVLQDEKATEDLKEAQAAINNLVKTAEDIVHGELGDSVVSSHILEVNQLLKPPTMEQTISPWNKEEQSLPAMFDKCNGRDTCVPAEIPEEIKASSQAVKNETVELQGANELQDLGVLVNATDTTSVPSSTSTTEIRGSSTDNLTSIKAPTEQSTQLKSSIAASSPLSSSPSPSASSKVQDSTSTGAHKSSHTSPSHLPQPTTQESFFKNVSKRLQLLEANSTLSLKYIEEQSKILREAFTKVEKRQLAKTTSFLENLNSTVLEQLRQFSKQYDQIWQSTVMELETQRDQSQRETAAVTARLNILADELIFQKRMSIVQSVLLLLCLAVVIFSRSLAGGYLEVPIIQTMMKHTRHTSNDTYGSPLESPQTHKPWTSPGASPWSGSDHMRQRSDESIRSLMSRSPDESPPTPYSNYSRHEEEYTPDGEGGYLREGEPMRLMKPNLVRQESTGYNPGLESPQWTDSASSPEDNARTRRPFAYPNGVRTSSSRSSATQPISNTAHLIAQIHRTVRSDGADSDRYDVFNDSASRPRDANADPDQIGIAISPPSPPSSPPRVRDSHDFSIARKPLPALPKDDD